MRPATCLACSPRPMRISKPLNLPRQSTDGPMKHDGPVNEVATMCQLPWSVTPHLHGVTLIRFFHPRSRCCVAHVILSTLEQRNVVVCVCVCGTVGCRAKLDRRDQITSMAVNMCSYLPLISTQKMGLSSLWHMALVIIVIIINIIILS